MMGKGNKTFITIALILLLLISIAFLLVSNNIQNREINGQRAYEDVRYQVELGPRTMGSQAHAKTAEWITKNLKDNNWAVDIQEATVSGLPLKNIIAKRGKGTPWIIIGSHYDSRAYADRDKTSEGQKQPVMGANDGASSVAVLLELARVLPARLDKQVWLVFFDAEDNGGITNYEWESGSNYFVSTLSAKPDAVVILDMVGDKDLNIYMERNSNPQLLREIWSIASESGYSQFIPIFKHAIIDDHIPFINAGINAVDVIDFDYPYWHTTQDTIDKISSSSLEIVGKTILKWLESYPR